MGVYVKWEKGNMIFEYHKRTDEWEWLEVNVCGEDMSCDVR